MTTFKDLIYIVPSFTKVKIEDYITTEILVTELELESILDTNLYETIKNKRVVNILPIQDTLKIYLKM